MINQTISHYKILEKLGEGGMGIVYKAHDVKLDRDVALKFLPHHLTAHEAEQARFLQEARAASALNHPNICAIYSIGEEGDQQFIEMEYVDGMTLREKITIGRLQIADCISYAIQMGEAFQEAHGKGIVHRDIKAENIMTNSKNQVKVMDFGLAKLKGSLKLTKTSSTVGTLAYMAPEQIQGGEVDARSDIFSFGVVLYEMLTGHLPFRGEHEAAMVYSIVNEEAQPVQSYLPDISSELVHIISRALEKDPEDRYQTMHDVVIDLRRVKKQTSSVSRVTIPHPTDTPFQMSVPAEQPRDTGWNRRKLMTVSGVVAVLAIATALVLFSSHSPKLNPNLTMRTLDLPFAEIGFTGISHDGNWVAFGAKDTRDLWSVYFMNVAGGNPRQLTSDTSLHIGYAEVSPEGNEIVYTRVPPGGKPEGIYVVSSNGGASRKIAEPANCPRWRPDGKQIGYIRSGYITSSGKQEFRTASPDGSADQLAFVDSLAQPGVSSTLSFAWSPDGNSVAWIRAFPDYEEIIIKELTSGKERQLTNFRKRIDEVAWASNGQIFFTSDKGGNTNVWMIPSDGGDAIQVTKGSGPDVGMQLSVDAQRMVFVQQSQIGYVWTIDVDGRNAIQLTSDKQQILDPVFSPDKKHILASVWPSDVLNRSSQIFLLRSDGTGRTQLTRGDGLRGNPSLSPDGKWMTFAMVKGEEPLDSVKIYLLEVSEPGTPRPIGKGYAGWWVNQDSFVYGFFGERSSVYSVRERKVVAVAPDTTWDFPLPDGRWTLVRDSRTATRGWWIRKSDATRSEPPKRLLPSLRYAWPSVSMKYLIFLQPNGECWRMSLPDGKQERLPRALDRLQPYTRFVQSSYDDKQMIYVKTQNDSKLVLVDRLFE